MTLIAALGSIILALVSLASYFFGKKQTAEVLLYNNNITTHAANLEVQVNANNAAIAAEKLKQAQITADLTKQENANVSQGQLTDFLNNPNSNGKS